jgi:septum formation inhibitor MinC
MKLDTQKDEMLTRYLLGDLPDAEKQRVEENFLKDDALFDEMVALEDELMYEYKQGNLTSREEKLFEKRFLATKQDKQKAIFADTFLKTIDSFAPAKQVVQKDNVVADVPWWKSLFSFQSPVLQFGMTAAMLLFLVGGAWLFYKNNQLKNDLATLQKQNDEQKKLEQQIEEKQRQKEQLEIQLAQEKQQREQNQEQIKKLEDERAKLEKEIKDARNQQTPKSSSPQNRTSIFAVLLPSLSRGSGETQIIKITDTVSVIKLRLQLKRDDEYKSYRAVAKNVDDGSEVFNRSQLKSIGRAIMIQLPAKSLKSGDYEITLEGIAGDGNAEVIDDYNFRVIRN